MLIKNTKLSVRAKNALINAGYENVEKCITLRRRKLLSLRNVGHSTVEEIMSYMKKKKATGKFSGQKKTRKEDNGAKLEYLIDVLSIPLDDIMFSVRSRNIFDNMHLKYMKDLVRASENQILCERNSGKKTVNEILDFLLKLDLDLQMRLSRELKLGIKEKLNKVKSQKYLLKRFRIKYPDKAEVLDELVVKVLTKKKVQFLKRCHELYKEGGTLEYVGEKVGLTRERIRQLLVQGTKYKLFEYTPHNYPYIPKGDLLNDIINEYGNLKNIAKKYKVAEGYLRRLLIAQGIKSKQIDECILKGRKKKLIDEYLQVKEKIGHHPSSTELQSRPKWRALEARMRRVWKSIHHFREELDIPAPPPFIEVIRPWIEHRTRIALIKRMQDLDDIREILKEQDVMQTSEIARDSGLSHMRVYKLVQMLISTGEVVKEGENSSTCYRIIQNGEPNENY